MANVLLTDYCNQNCHYCFARKMMDGKKGNISITNFKTAVDYLKKNGEKRLGVIGGEPTLHPDLFTLLDYAIRNGFHVKLFTNGIMHKEVSEGIAEYESHNLSILLNMNEKDCYAPWQLNRIVSTLERLNDKIGLGYTIYKDSFSLGFHRDMIVTHSLKKQLRIGLASPIAGMGDEDLLKRSDQTRLGQMVIDNVAMLEKDDILVNLDCGFYMCLFTTEQMGILTEKAAGFKSLCDPVIDIDPDLNAHCCFPLTGLLQKRICNYPELDGLIHYYKRMFEALRILGNGGKCMSCKYLKRGQCRGWCLGRVLNSQEGLMEKIIAIKERAETKEKSCMQ